jgi:radical SAM superfamily enzyme YgiQ (UPF0313 family)
MLITFAHLGREHLGLEYLSAVLKQAGHSVTLAYDCGLFGPEDNVLYSPTLERLFSRRERVIQAIEKSNPDLVGFTVYTGTFRWACDIASEVKRRLRVPIVFGGIHASLVPQKVIEKECVDYVVVGEGEYALLDLLDRLKSGARPDGIPNVWWKEGSEIRPSPVRPPIDDLDSLPLPDKGLFETDVNYRDDYLTMSTRGCLFRCSFCCESHVNRLYGNKFYRRRSPDGMLTELQEMKKRYGFREVNFFDPVFFIDKAWLREFLTAYRDRIGVPFRCFGHTTFMDDEVAGLLKEGGCYAIEFGFQTANESVRRNILGRSETEEANLRAFQTCDRFGIRYDLDHIFNLPEETEDDLIAAARYYGERKLLNRVKCHNLTYFPGLAIVKTALERGELSDADLVALEEGQIHDFFHEDGIRDLEKQRRKRCFAKLYKLLPLLPKRLLDALLERRRYLWMRFVPGPVVWVGQFLNGMLKRDLRFAIYLRYIALRLWRHFVG